MVETERILDSSIIENLIKMHAVEAPDNMW